MNIRDSLIDYMMEGMKEQHLHVIGMEAEHFILREDTREAVPYSGESGIGELLYRLMEKVPESKPLPGDDMLGFTAPDYAITLEPAAQLEISVNATEDIGKINRIYNDFLGILAEVLSSYGYVYLTVGTQPVSKVRMLNLIPKERYFLMDRYFAGTGNGGIEMMRGTCSVQVSIDYFSEEDFRNKIQAVSFYTPLFKLLSDNSAVFEGNEIKGHLARTDIWNRTDKSRCGVLPGIFKRDYGFGDYADFLLDMPLIFTQNEDGAVYTGNRTVREIYNERCPVKEEVIHIQSMAFPDVRVKQYLEIRAADAMPEEYAIAYCALVKGLLYSDEGISYAADRIRESELTEQDIRDSEQSLMRYGWDGEVYGEPVKKAVDNMLYIAKNNIAAEEGKYMDIFNKVIECGVIVYEDREYS